jgi:ribonuclease HIII
MPVSISINVDELDRLRNYVLSCRLKRVPTTNEYELLRIKDGEIDIVVYKSGKLVHNDSTNSREIIDNILAKETDFDYILGTDEVGKGEWYGPLVTTCVALTSDDLMKFRKIGVRDSKLLKQNELERLAQEILRAKIVHKHVVLMPEVYNTRYEEFKKEKKSLNDLLAWSHVRAIASTLVYLHGAKIKVVIDKFDFKKTDLRLKAAKIKDANIEIIQSSKGDTEIPVSVASILAKHEFEKRVEWLNRKHNLDLKKADLSTLPADILPYISKTSFKNVSKLLRS